MYTILIKFTKHQWKILNSEVIKKNLIFYTNKNRTEFEFKTELKISNLQFSNF